MFGNISDDRKWKLAALGSGLSQLAMGQPVNIAGSQAGQMVAQRRQRQALEESGILNRFSPEQRAILAQMPPSAAQSIIAQQAFRQPAAPTAGKVVGDRLVNPITGQVIADFSSSEKTKPIVVNGQLVNPETGDVIGDYRDAEAESGKPIVREVTLADGSEALVQWNSQTEQWEPAKIPEGGTGAQPKNKLTESQSKLTLFQSLQDDVAPVINEMEESFNPANVSDAVAGATPIAGNFFRTPQGQQYAAAAAQWAEGALRIATGAAATQPEIERTKNTYFAQPGDAPETIRFKQQLRASYTRAIRRSLGEVGVEGEMQTPEDFAASYKAPASPGDDGLPNFATMSDEELNAWIKDNGG